MPPSDRHQGIVQNNKDPASAGRIKAKLSNMDGDQYPEWIEPIQPAGVVMHPHQGDTVELELPEGEDIVEHSQEVKYLGKRGTDASPYPSKYRTNYPDRRGMYTPGGHYFVFDDKDRKVFIETAGGHTIELDDAAGQVSITNSDSGDTWKNTALGTSTIESTLKTHLDSPFTDLNDLSTDFLIKGTTYNIAEQALMGFLATMNTAFNALTAKWKDLADNSPGASWIPSADSAEIDALKTALDNLGTGITTFQGAVLTWTSLKTKTG